MKELQDLICNLTEINIRETKNENLVWFILSKPNVYVIIFYQSTPPPPTGAQPWGVVTSRKNFFLFFNSICQECLLFFCIAYLFKLLCLLLVKIVYFMVLPMLLKV